MERDVSMPLTGYRVMVVSLSKTKVTERDFQVNCHIISTEKYSFLLITHSSNGFILPPCNFCLSSIV